MKSLTVNFSHVRGIEKMEVKMPLTPDVYAITGLNGVGKSTLLTCLTCRMIRPINFAGLHPQDFNANSFIEYSIDGISERWGVTAGEWSGVPNSNLQIRGFHEGSMTKGTRFSHIFGYGYYRDLLNVRANLLVQADKFISSNLGLILHNRSDFYDDLYRLDRKKAEQYYKYKGVLYYRKVGEKFISQFDLSTGELMLINLLHLINTLLVRNGNTERLNLILIDEVELALHPSAIRRLIPFMKDIAKRYGVAIYFATHSLEIIYELPVENLIYLQQSGNNEVECISPCYPSYISRDIYMHYGYDMVILVEDDLAKYLVDKYISKNKLEINKRIQVLPVGGYDNTLTLHENLLTDRVLNPQTCIISILDGDVEVTVQRKRVNDYMWQCVPTDSIMFLPIESLEKFLKHKLFDEKDYSFMRKVRDHFFRFEAEVDWYEPKYLANITNKKAADLSKGKPILKNTEYFANGKNLFSILEEKASLASGMNRSDFRQGMCSFVIDNFSFEEFETALSQKMILD